MKHTVDAMGKQCPIPVVMTKKILDKAEPVSYTHLTLPTNSRV